MKDIRLRQIHLDFHTSEAIEGVGKDFNPDTFADMLVHAHVNSITCFSRCHHGWLYYPSKRFPERIHPHLERKDLLGDQIAACHARGIQVHVYLPIQWDLYTTIEHPEWLVLDADGRPIGTGPYEAGFYRQLCLNTPYRDILVSQALEVMEMYPIDGLFLDIINVRECSCNACRKGMLEMEMDPTSPKARQIYTRHVIKEFTDYVSAALRAVQPDIAIFYNHSHVRLSHRDIIGGFTHLELESLPAGGWGYWDFPITIRYARTLGVPCIGQTGKFHTGWGDFNSLKTRSALEFECFRSLAFGAGCSIGDQLHPYGMLSKETYDLIGNIYSSVEKKEPWCRNSKPVVEIAVVSPDRFEGTARGGLSPDISGCVRMLQEAGFQFDIVDEYSDLRLYKLVVLPDHVIVDKHLGINLKDFIDGGGSVISSYRSGLDPETGSYRHLDFGVVPGGAAPYEPDFIVPEPILASGLSMTDHVMYLRGECVNPGPDTEVLAWVNSPFFNRTWEHFCSHKHAPTSYQQAYPGIVRHGSWIHFIHPIYTIYHKMDPLWCKQLVVNAIELLMPDRLVRHNGPSTVVVTINEQKTESRYVLHILHYIPERRGEQFDTIQDVIPLCNLDVLLRLPKRIVSARIVPEKIDIPIADDDRSQRIHLDRIVGHCMVELRYEP